jgi:hypothetical protein
MEFEIKLPSPDSPGFLYRTKRALLLKRALEEITPDTVDEIVEFLVPYVVHPEDIKDKRKAIENLSQTQFIEIFGSIAGGQGESQSPQT